MEDGVVEFMVWKVDFVNDPAHSHPVMLQDLFEPDEIRIVLPPFVVETVPLRVCALNLA